MIKNLTKNFNMEGFTKGIMALFISIMIVELFNLYSIVTTDHVNITLRMEYVKPEIIEAESYSTVGFSKFLSDI